VHWATESSDQVVRAGLARSLELAAGGADNEDIRTGNGIAGETAELFTP
jgi:hypothetical protein